MTTTTTRKTYRVSSTVEGGNFIRGYAAGVNGDFSEDLQQSLPPLDLLMESVYLTNGQRVWDIRMDLIEDAVAEWNRS